MTFLIGLDIGTQSTKAQAMDEDAEVPISASSEYPISAPRPGWAEQRPEWWWNAAKITIRRVLRDAKLGPEDIAGVGVCGQMHGLVLIDKKLQPLRPAIIWMDKRSTKQCEQIKRKVGADSTPKLVCNPIMPGFMAPSLLWIKQNEPRTYARVHKAMLPKDFVRLKLTGEIATDVSDASSTLLFDVKKRRWSARLLSLLGIPSDAFPDAFESPVVVGEISGEASRETGLKKGTPVVAGAGDSEAGAVGCGVIKPGVISSNIGTGGQVFSALEEIKVDPRMRVHTFCHAVPGKWHLQGAILSAGLSLKWFADNFGLPGGRARGSDIYDRLAGEAEQAEPGARGLIFLPYLIGERSPHMDPKARGVFVGLTLAHGRKHLIRAIMEGVGFALRDCHEVFKELGVSARRVIARGGGAKSRLWLEIQADMYGAEVVTLKSEVDAAQGAALLAGVGAGVYGSVGEACERTVKTVSKTFPDPKRKAIYDRNYRIYTELYRSLRKHFSFYS